MKDIVQASTGVWWREVETTEEATQIGSATQTAFGHFFQMEHRYGVKNRYFALGADYKVIGCVPLTPPPYKGRPAHGMPLFVTHLNANPFPQYEREISELAHAIGAKITSAHYPYREADADLSEQGHDDSPSPGA